MKDFLALVAEDLIRRHGHDLSHTVIIFPNKRANLFFNEHLTPQDGTPVWAPRYMSISELFNALSEHQLIDPIEAVCRLYRHYTHYIQDSPAPLDSFYGWGERLLADFDDIDKSLVDARKLFRDITDYADLEQSDFLDQEQIEQLKLFSSDFKNPKQTALRKNFNRIWNVAYQIYSDFRDELLADHQVYEGLMFREVIEQLQSGHMAWPEDMEQIVFVGFNVIDTVEQALFKHLQDAGKALFYWDYDTYYAGPANTSQHEAGVFIQANLKDFPNALPDTGGCFDNFLQDCEHKTLEFASSPTDTAQAQSVSDWLQSPEHFDPANARRTAIVICDETLLQSVIHALPDTVGNINITKGFPLGHTQAFNGVLTQMDAVIQHQFKATSPVSVYDTIRLIQDRMVEETRHMEQLYADNTWLNVLNTEAYFQIFTVLNRFLRLIEEHYLEASLPMVFSLIRQVLRGLSVPFHGEPAEGLQIMGVLETRCLDFDHILMLSVGEGILPRKTSENSFIPYLLRKQYGLTTPERQNSVFAYYFYRLIQRAKNVRLTYNSSTSGTSKGEMSRFMKSLLIEHARTLNIQNLRLNQSPRTLNILTGEEVHKRPQQAVAQSYSFSPSALKAYIKCQLQYYYQYILGLKKPQEQDSIINSNDFGTVFHSAAEHLFLDVLNGATSVITPDTLTQFLSKEGKLKLDELTRKAFAENQIVSSDITHLAVFNYLIRLLQYEAGKGSAAPAISWTGITPEQKNSMTLQVPLNGKYVPVSLYGYIDRRDEAELPDGTHCMRIIDYKTGKKKNFSFSMDDLFEGKKDFPENPFQACLYALIWCERTQLPVIPMLYYVPSMDGKTFTPYLQLNQTPIMDFHPLAEEFKQRLTEKLAEIIDPDHDFVATTQKEHCKYCDFRELCGQNKA